MSLFLRIWGNQIVKKHKQKRKNEGIIMLVSTWSFTSIHVSVNQVFARLEVETEMLVTTILMTDVISNKKIRLAFRLMLLDFQ